MPNTQQYAYLSKQIYQEPNVNESYADRQIKPEYISPDGHKYWVIARASNSQTGYQGTIYQDQQSKELIVAHRGTEPTEKGDLHSVASMVGIRINTQVNDAQNLVNKAIEIFR